MVMPQQPQYGQQYGAVPPQQAPYGAPPAPQAGIGAPPPEVKWDGLETGGAFKCPVVCFTGRLTDIVEDYGSQYGLRLIEKWDQVQILESPVPWPWATLDYSIKYSSKENSAWGHHVTSAKALGLAEKAPNLAAAKAELVGKMYEMRQVAQSYGEDRTTGNAMTGDVWRFIRIIQPGMAQPFPQPQYAQPAVSAAPVQPQPVAGTPPPQPAQTGVAQPVPSPGAVAPNPTPVQAPNQPVATPAQGVSAGAFDPTPSPDDTAQVRAKKLLNGMALNEWLGKALMDDKIKADAAFINTIYDQSFITALKASGQVQQGADGKFIVVS